MKQRSMSSPAKPAAARLAIVVFMGTSDDALAVLLRAGPHRAILLCDSLETYSVVHPLYVRTGAHWEEVELAHVQRFLSALEGPFPAPLQLLDQPVADLYGEHWSLTGKGV